MSAIKTETVAQRKICTHCGAPFDVTDTDLEFYKKVSPVFGGKKYQIPTPTFCPDCRQQRRLAFRNRRKLYKRTCDLTGDSILSQFSPNARVPVFRAREWESDAFDAGDYARNFDFSDTFFKQFEVLFWTVPQPHLAVIESTLVNCDYVNGANDSKNVYLSNNIVACENVYYSEGAYHSEDCSDCLYVNDCRTCYECVSS